MSLKCRKEVSTVGGVGGKGGAGGRDAMWVHESMEVLKKMARIVDNQTKNDPTYKKMSDDYEKSLAFSAACDLVFKGRIQPSGYTEPLLHQKRLEKKSKS